MWHLRPLSPSYTNRTHAAAAAAAKSLQSCPTLCDPIDGSLPGSPSLGFSRQEHWSGLPFPSPVQESEKWKWSCSDVPTLSGPMDCSLPGSSIHGIFQARVREWGTIAFSTGHMQALSSLQMCNPSFPLLPWLKKSLLLQKGVPD